MNQEITITGIAKKGDGRGRSLGFPTANLDVENSVLPDSGVYAAKVTINNDDKLYEAAIHVGPRPTYNDSTPTFEVHLLDFPDQDLYGRAFTVNIVKRLRGIIKFKNSKALSKALATDCQLARKALSNNR